MTHDRPHEIQHCIDVCQECHEACLALVDHCLRKGGRHADAAHIRMLLDCAQICGTSADFMIRGSDLHPETCRACAAVCDRCAEDCTRLGDDEAMRACVDVCHRCAQSCHQMAGALTV